jgi:RNA polymerase sigma factor (sigma-70 family)
MSAGAVECHAHVQSLYRDHHLWLQRWLRRRLDDAGYAADLAQDSFVRVLKASNAGQIRQPREYLTTIAKGLLIDYFRRRTVEQAYLELVGCLPEAQMPSLEAQAIVIETLLQVDAMLDGLQPKVRQTFLLSQLEGLGYREIASKLGISLRTVNNYMTLALTHCSRLPP